MARQDMRLPLRLGSAEFQVPDTQLTVRYLYEAYWNCTNREQEHLRNRQSKSKVTPKFNNSVTSLLDDTGDKRSNCVSIPPASEESEMPDAPTPGLTEASKDMSDKLTPNLNKLHPTEAVYFANDLNPEVQPTEHLLQLARHRWKLARESLEKTKELFEAASLASDEAYASMETLANKQAELAQYLEAWKLYD
jgi:hypothetical protein